jgi:hypothetical protein
MTETCTATPTFTATTLPPTHTPTPLASQPVVYPNPVTGPVVSIQLPVANASDVSVKIFTLSMRLVQTIDVSQVAGIVLTVPLADKNGMALANGLYYFLVRINGQKWVEKVLVLR